jgi:hypothetical protein
MPEFFTYYGRLFKESRIMERIVPRELDNAGLKSTFPYLFTNDDGKEFDNADVSGVN